MNTSCEIEQRGDIVILTPTSDVGELDYAQFRSDAQPALDLLARGVCKNVVVDFCHTDYIGSEAIGFFVELWKAAAGRMAVCNLSQHEQQILAIARLGDKWPVYADREAAIQAVQQS